MSINPTVYLTRARAPLPRPLGPVLNASNQDASPLTFPINFTEQEALSGKPININTPEHQGMATIYPVTGSLIVRGVEVKYEVRQTTPQGNKVIYLDSTGRIIDSHIVPNAQPQPRIIELDGPVFTT